MLSKWTILFGGLVACLWGAAAAAQTTPVNAFGFNYSPLGNATLDASSGTGVVVGNLGSAGQDGVSINLSGVQGSGLNFGLDTSLASLGTPPIGASMEQQGYGSLGGGVNQLLSTGVLTQSSSGVQVTLDLSPVWNGQPTTLDYYSGGPGGTLVYSETESGPTTSFEIAPPNPHPNPPPWPIYTYYNDWYIIHGVPLQGATYGIDGFFGSIVPPLGTVLANDNIDFIDFSVPSTAAVQYSSTAITAGGGISSFEITGEAATTPEPSTLVLLGIGTLGLLGYARWRRART